MSEERNLSKKHENDQIANEKRKKSPLQEVIGLLYSFLV